MVIAYEYNNGLYLNITNRCTNRCCFCLRDKYNGVGDYHLWLEREPEAEEVIESIKKELKPLTTEIVFCGYGEPLMRPDVVAEVAAWVKKNTQLPIRVNSNGLANLIHEKNILPELAGLIDVISISLNAEDAKKYNQICRPAYGEKSYRAILNFITESKKYIPKVVASIVTNTGADPKKCRRLAEEMGVEFREREMF